jgi:hypothetical protein
MIKPTTMEWIAENLTNELEERCRYAGLCVLVWMLVNPVPPPAQFA